MSKARTVANGVDESGSYYNSMRIYQNSTTVGGESNTNGTSTIAIHYSSASYANQSSSSYDIFSPKLAKPTNYIGGFFYTNSSGTGYQNTMQGVNWTSSQYDGITVYPASGTISGKLRVYGYKNS